MKKEEIIVKREEFLKQLIVDKQKEIKKAPRGKIRFSKHRAGWQYFYQKEPQDGRGTYISKSDMVLLSALAQKRYDQQLINVAEDELKKLKKIKKKNVNVEEVYDNMPQALQQYINPIKETNSQIMQKWLASEYEKKGFETGSPEYYSNKNERMRSKSEVIIANEFDKLGVPYLYEKPLKLKGYGVIHPDFTFYDIKKRREIYWEHLGKVDDIVYIADNAPRIAAYEQNGYILGDNLWVSFETKDSPLNMKALDNKIPKLKQKII